MIKFLTKIALMIPPLNRLFKENNYLLQEVEKLKQSLRDNSDCHVDYMDRMVKLDESFTRLMNSHEEIGRIIRNQDNNIIQTLEEIGYIQRKINIVMQRNASQKLPIKVLFIVHFLNNWATLEPIYKAMASMRDKFNPYVVTVNFHLYGEPQKSTEINTVLEQRDIPFIDWGDMSSNKYLLQYLNPDVIFRQSPYEASLPKSLHTYISGAYKICYIPYGLDIVQIPESAVNTELHFAAWRIYACSVLQARYLQEESKVKADNIRVVGNPRLDSIAYKLSNNPVISKRNSYKVLWAPHHSVTDQWLSFGTFPDTCWSVLDFAKVNIDIEFIMRPHHIFIDVLKDSKKMTNTEIEFFFEEWNALPNTSINNFYDYEDLFIESDVLLCDGISFLTEYQITGKPVIFIERINHMRFNIFGDKVTQGMYRFINIDDALNKIISLKNLESDFLKEKRIEIRNILMPTNGNSVNAILDDIIENV